MALATLEAATNGLGCWEGDGEEGGSGAMVPFDLMNDDGTVHTLAGLFDFFDVMQSCTVDVVNAGPRATRRRFFVCWSVGMKKDHLL